MKNLLILCGVSVIFGCVSYEPEPLDRNEISRKIIEELKPPETKPSDTFEFKDAVQLLSESNKELETLKQAYENALKEADIATPWPNPEVTFGLARAYRLNERSASSTQPFASLVFTIPFSGRLSLEDDLKSIQGEKSLQSLMAKHRNLFMNLRLAFIDYSINRNHLKHQQKVIDLMDRILRSNKTLTESGFYSALDIHRIQLEALNQKSSEMEIEAGQTSKRGAIENLISKNLPSGVVEEPLKADFPIPELEAVWEITLKENPVLNELYMEHLLSEKKLELEIRKQYPDFKIGTDGEQDPGEKTRYLSLSVGIDLPVFDRNQVQIQKALSQRNNIKMKFEAKASELRLKLMNNLKLLKLKMDHYKHCRDKVVPKMEELLVSARKAVEAGHLPVRDYWDYRIRSLEIEKDLFVKKAHIYQVVATLESLAGRPLIEIFKFDKQLFAELETVK